MGGFLPPDMTSFRKVVVSKSRQSRQDRTQLPFWYFRDWLLNETHSELRDAHAPERAPEASEARRAKRSGRAVNGGHEGRRERPAMGMGIPERSTSFTESSDILSDFPWAGRHKAKVCGGPLLLMGGFLPPDGSAGGRSMLASDLQRQTLG